MPKVLNVLAKVSDLCRRRGFVLERSRCNAEAAKNFVGNVFDFGPLGVEMKRILTSEWWREIVTSRDNVYGVDLSMVFHAPYGNTHGKDGTSKDYSSSETVCVNYQVSETCRCAMNFMENYGIKIPFGLAQNLRMLSRGNDDIDQFIFRSCQKEFLKLCFFCPPNKLNYWMDYWMRKRLSWWKKYADMPAGFSLADSDSMQLFCQESNSSLADTMTVKFDFPWGKEAIECISSYSNIKELLETDLVSTEQLGVVIATSSIEKGILAYLLDAFNEKQRMSTQGVTSTYNALRLHPVLSPVKVAVLSNNQLNTDLCRVAQQLAFELRQAGIASSYIEYKDHEEGFEDCYAEQDEVGTPYCVTVQDTTLTNGIVTLRNRDTTLSEFLHISEILKTVQRHLDSF